MNNKTLLKSLSNSIFKEKISEKISQSNCKIQLKNFVGSSKSIIAASILKSCSTPQLFILNDKESANYFINDLENSDSDPKEVSSENEESKVSPSTE